MRKFLFRYQGRRAPLRVALAPGYYIPRLRAVMLASPLPEYTFLTAHVFLAAFRRTVL